MKETEFSRACVDGEDARRDMTSHSGARVVTQETDATTGRTVKIAFLDVKFCIYHSSSPCPRFTFGGWVGCRWRRGYKYVGRMDKGLCNREVEDGACTCCPQIN